MNQIKGLIIKDLLQLRNYRKTLIIFIVIFILTSMTGDETKAEGSLLPIMLALGFGMFSIASFNYDELAKADKYILTLPLTKKEIVLSKYILIMIATTIGTILGIIGSLAITMIVKEGQIPNIKELIQLGLGSMLGIGIIEAIQIPCIYKWGAEKGRIQMFIVLAMGALLIAGMVLISQKVKIELQANRIFTMLDSILPIILIVAMILTYFISYKISYKIYRKKEV